jgi:hypothetical protein
MKNHTAFVIATSFMMLLSTFVNATNQINRKTLLNAGWQFHLGELPVQEIPRKLSTKAGFTGGASILTREEGIQLTPPGVFAKILGGGNADFLYSFYGVVPALSEGWEKVNIPPDWMFRQEYQAPKERPAGFSMESDANNGYLPDSDSK